MDMSKVGKGKFGGKTSASGRNPRRGVQAETATQAARNNFNAANYANDF